VGLSRPIRAVEVELRSAGVAGDGSEAVSPSPAAQPAVTARLMRRPLKKVSRSFRPTGCPLRELPTEVSRPAAGWIP
jgi:hypothetical protein